MHELRGSQPQRVRKYELNQDSAYRALTGTLERNGAELSAGKERVI